jgi:AP-3 complex subunit beta
LFFQSYVEYDDPSFVTAAIQAIGRCAAKVPEVTDRCLHGLMSLVGGSKSGKKRKEEEEGQLNEHSTIYPFLTEVVTAESVVVIRKLLQMLNDSKGEDVEQTMTEVIIHLSQLLEKIEAPSARSSITWVIGEYTHKIPKIAPDILRKLAKTFTNEDDSGE